jgi:hypothetical protein
MQTAIRLTAPALTPCTCPLAFPQSCSGVTAYDYETMSGLDNGQPFPSLNQMDKPAANADGSIDVYFGPTSPSEGRNYVATVPGKRFAIALRLYGPRMAFFDQSWKPDDVTKLK